MMYFMGSMLLTDFFCVHAWRIISDDGACVPSFDWFTLWGLGSLINVVFVVTAWLYPPYTLVMLRTTIISSAFLVIYYIVSCVSRGEFCGSMFVAIPSMTIGIVNILAVPDKLCVFREFDEEYDVYSEAGEKVAKAYSGVGGGNGSISVYYGGGGEGITTPFTEDDPNPIEQHVDDVFEEVDVVTPEEREIIKSGFSPRKSMQMKRPRDNKGGSFSVIKNILSGKSAYGDAAKEEYKEVQITELKELKGKEPAS
jgi:hypothetical protein